ncbi:hypothetical protein E8E12_004147 [Didymella heteroderae]|uniref:Hydrolase n=1 Tax=Didymella heteroderae TaxID=1769908 RepID=A0A9P4WMI3_9PLEO|nr:hypothetical protein E8E12_004147 [Didymella heteroderae]
MLPTRVQCSNRNLLLCFDAFGTLFQPNVPIPRAYAEAAIRHGVKCDGNDSAKAVGQEFKRAFKESSRSHPNYGRDTGLGAEKWWRNVINNTFKQWLEPGQDAPKPLVDELLRRYSTKEGYDIFPDVLPFFQMLRTRSSTDDAKSWPWKNTVVGIITNSDDRVPGILESFGLKVGPRRVGTPDEREADAALEDDISFVVLSYDVGVEKPQREIFDAAYKSFQETLVSRGDESNAQSWDKMYIGDSLEHDVVGASLAGWKALRLERQKQGQESLKSKGIRITHEHVKTGGGSYDIKIYTIRDLEALGAIDPTNEWPGKRLLKRLAQASDSENEETT